MTTLGLSNVPLI